MTIHHCCFFLLFASSFLLLLIFWRSLCLVFSLFTRFSISFTLKCSTLHSSPCFMLTRLSYSFLVFSLFLLLNFWRYLCLAILLSYWILLFFDTFKLSITCDTLSRFYTSHPMYFSLQIVRASPLYKEKKWKPTLIFWLWFYCCFLRFAL